MAADIISEIISDIIEDDSEVKPLKLAIIRTIIFFFCKDNDSSAPSSVNLLAVDIPSDEMLPELDSTLEEEEEDLDDFHLELNDTTEEED